MLGMIMAIGRVGQPRVLLSKLTYYDLDFLQVARRSVQERDGRRLHRVGINIPVHWEDSGVGVDVEETAYSAVTIPGNKKRGSSSDGII